MTSKCHLYIPPLIVILLLALTYYIYVITFCVYLINDLLTSLVYLFFFNVIFAMCLWCFLSVVFTPVAKVPLEYQLTNEEVENYGRSDEHHRNLLLKSIAAKRNLVLNMCSPDNRIRYCTTCSVIKPDRVHHCSSCGVCILKMDHHCGWINNCVGFSNQKLFILMLFYCNMYCIYYISTTVEYFMRYMYMPNRRYLPVVVGFLMTAVFGLMVAIFFLFHCGLLFRNETTLEKIQQVYFTQDNTSFDLGSCRNFKEVFGTNWKLWLFPVVSAVGNGAVFPVVVKQA